MRTWDDIVRQGAARKSHRWADDMTFIASMEGYHVAELDTAHADERPWLRVYDDAGFLYNSFQRHRWLFNDKLPDTVRQFVESYARLIS